MQEKACNGGYPPVYWVRNQKTPPNMAPSQHRKGRTGFLVRIPDTLYIKFKKKADIMGTTMSDILLTHIVSITADIELTREDYEELARNAKSN